MAATFAGHLHYRGIIMEHVDRGLPLAQWDNDVLLAYFTSNIDPHRNFNKFFRETRARIYGLLVDRASGELTATDEVYLRACMEYKQHPAVMDVAHPVKHQAEFISLIKQYPNSLVVRNQALTQRLLKLAGKHIARLREKHWDKVAPDSRTYIDFFVPPRDKAAKKKKRTRGKGKGRGKDNAEDSDEDVHDVASAAIDPTYQADPHQRFHYDSARIHPCTHNNILMQGLIAPMPGLHFGTTVTLVDDDTFATANLRDALPGTEQDGDGDLDMNAEGHTEDPVALAEYLRYTETVKVDDEWGVLIL